MRVKGISIILSATLLIFSGCTSSSGPNTAENRVVEGKGKQQNLFEEYKKDRPEAKAVKIGSASVDLTYDSIAKIYGKTVDVTDKYIKRVENSKVILTLEEVRKSMGEEEYKKQVALLEGEDKKEYEAFMKNEVNTLEVASTYLIEALKLQTGIASFDIKSLISNPFKLPAALKGSSLAMSQVNYTIKTLKWLKETRDVYQATLEYKGR